MSWVLAVQDDEPAAKFLLFSVFDGTRTRLADLGDLLLLWPKKGTIAKAQEGNNSKGNIIDM